MAHIPFHQFTDNQAHQKELFFGGIVSHSARIVCVIAGVAKDGGQPINASGTNDPDDGDSLASKSLTSTASQLNHNSAKPTDPSSVTTVAKTNVPFTLGASSSNTTTSTTKSSSTFFSLNKNGRHNEDKEKDTIQTQSMLSFHSSDDAKFENSFLYQNMKRRVEELEDSMLASAEIMDFDKAKIKELTQHVHDIESENDSLKQQSNDLHFQMEHLQTDYEILMRENESLKATIAKYTLEGGKLQSLLQKATDELNIQQDAKFKLEQLLKEKNDECEDLLAELIKTKVAVAELIKTKVAVGDLNGELDETKKQLRILRGGGRGGSAPAASVGGGGGASAPRGPGEMTDRRPPQLQSNGAPRERVPSSDMGNRPAPPSNSQPYNNPQYSTPNYNNNPGPAQGRQRQGVSSTDYYMNNGNYTPSVGNNNGYNPNTTQSGYNSNNPAQNGYNPNQNVTSSGRGGPGGAGPDYYSYNNSSNNNMNGSSSRPSISQPPPAPASSSRAFIPSQGYGNPTPSQSQSTNSNGNSFTSSIKRGFGGW
eukprot:gene13981-15439_t